MEMHGSGLDFSSEIPIWAKILLGILMTIFFGVSLGGLYFAGLSFYTKEYSLIIIGLIFAGSFGWLVKIGFTTLKTYEKWSFKVQLTDDGYFMEVMNKRTYEIHRELVRFDQMEEVAISKALNAIPRKINTLFYTTEYLVNAVLLIIWRDDAGQKHVKHFTHSKKSDLDEWLKVFDQHNIPITVTDIDLRGVPSAELLPSIERVDKKAYKWDGAFEKVLKVGSITREKPLRLEQRFKKVHAFRVPVKFIFLLSILFNSWFIYRIGSQETLDFAVIDLPILINVVISGLFMYFTRKLSVINLLKYLGFLTLFLWVSYLIFSLTGIISFPFSDDLFAANFLIIMGSSVLYPFIRVLRDVWKAEYHGEIKEHQERLEKAGYQGMA
jgi:hypothetical protein